MIVRLARRVASSYTGASTVYLSALAALGVTALAWRFLARAPVYTDVIVGETTWENIDKAGTSAPFICFSQLRVLLAVALSWSRRRKAAAIETSDSAMLKMTFILATLPAIWWLAVAATAPQNATVHCLRTLRYAVLAVIAAVVVAGVAYLRRDEVAPPRTSIPRTEPWMFGRRDRDSWCVRRFGLSHCCQQNSSGAGPCYCPRVAFVRIGRRGIALTLLRTISRDSPKEVQNLDLLQVRLLLAVQIPLPLLFFVVIPPPVDLSRSHRSEVSTKPRCSRPSVLPSRFHGYFSGAAIGRAKRN